MSSPALQDFYARPIDELLADPHWPQMHAALLDALESGAVRAAERGADGRWRANAWVKQAILVGFRRTEIERIDARPAPFFDKSAYAPRAFELGDRVRLVPGGSSVRRGAHLAAGVVVMPPAYVNVGAYVGAGTMIDSHALVGSCAQIGARVHLSAGAQIGGVLEPAGATPVVVEDDAFVGGNTGLYEGVCVRSRAVIASGVVLSASTVVYDLVEQRELRGTRENPLAIPEGAVVVPGSRPVTQSGPLDLWATQRGLHVGCALVVKYRDAKTDAATALESALR
ncbi:MAG: 2,3,4,5-tetrahydropyridine-2,6-dicarboxylate N-succinyltransferase [Planctomycetes bacterium]|nr:2,3,4,5-tetrahydropyridine-2,6-dicarboxylate N-succinyltransferase [Planctomycetota bacterium]